MILIYILQSNVRYLSIKTMSNTDIIRYFKLPSVERCLSSRNDRQSCCSDRF